MILVDAEQVVDDLEALRAFGVVDAADIDQSPEAAAGIVAQELEQRQERIGCRPQDELAPNDLALGDMGAGLRRDIPAELLQRFRHLDAPVLSGRSCLFGGSSSAAAECR